MSGRRPVLLIATANRGKLAEYRRLLGADVPLVGLGEVAVTLPPEDGTTFAENADVKALAAAEQSGLLTLADDSGLEVDALAGAPGIRSARFAGEPTSDERNRNRLLQIMTGISSGRRGARFVCALSLARPGRIVARSLGECAGEIAARAVGAGGFGYDPIFLLPDGRTMAELAPAEKDAVSHRAAALRPLLPRLRQELTP